MNWRTPQADSRARTRSISAASCGKGMEVALPRSNAWMVPLPVRAAATSPRSCMNPIPPSVQQTLLFVENTTAPAPAADLRAWRQLWQVAVALHPYSSPDSGYGQLRKKADILQLHGSRS